MRISIALCTYNGARFVREQLESMLAQTRLPDELIICDDGSSDSTCEIVKEFAACAPFAVRLQFNKNNLGTTRNFEQAVRLCTGDIVVFSDQDDVWLPNRLAVTEKAFVASPRCGMVLANAELVDESLQPLSYDLWNYFGFTPGDRRMLKKGKIINVMLKRNIALGATMAFHARFKELVLPIPGNWGHDKWIAFLIAAVADADTAIVDEKVIKYRQHAANQIGAKKKSFTELLSIARSTSTKEYLEEIARLMAVHEIVIGGEGYNFRTGTANLIEDKVKNLSARAYLAKSRWLRLVTLLRELMTLRYHRYSRGFNSFFKDLLFPR